MRFLLVSLLLVLASMRRVARSSCGVGMVDVVLLPDEAWLSARRGEAMARCATSDHDPCMIDLTAIATSLPDVASGVACAGTALESRTFTTNKKAFLFVSTKDVRLKLDASSAAAKKAGFDVGANGWVKLPLRELPAAATLKKWIAESHALMTPAAKATKTPAATTKKPAKR